LPCELLALDTETIAARIFASVVPEKADAIAHRWYAGGPSASITVTGERGLTPGGGWVSRHGAAL